jgi:hypothetical protein
LVHKIYICSNTKTSFGLQQHDQIMDCTNANDVLHSSSNFVFMLQVQPQQRELHSLWPCTIVIAPCADVKTSSLAAHLSNPRTTCHQDREDDGSIPVMPAHTRSPLQQHDYFTDFDCNNNLAAATSAFSTSTSSHSVWDNVSKLCTCPSLGVWNRVPPWPPPFMPIGDIGGVADFKLQAKITQ